MHPSTGFWFDWFGLDTLSLISYLRIICWNSVFFPTCSPALSYIILSGAPYYFTNVQSFVTILLSLDWRVLREKVFVAKYLQLLIFIYRLVPCIHCVSCHCSMYFPQTIRSAGVMLKCLFDDSNVLGKHISDITSSCSWATYSWSWSNRIDFLSAVGFIPSTILAAMFFACWCAQSTSSITWDAAATLRLRFFL